MNVQELKVTYNIFGVGGLAAGRYESMKEPREFGFDP